MAESDDTTVFESLMNSAVYEGLQTSLPPSLPRGL